MEIIEGGGFKLYTTDPIMKAVVARCADLESDLAAARRQLQVIRHQETARYRTLRRDVSHIKRAVVRAK